MPEKNYQPEKTALGPEVEALKERVEKIETELGEATGKKEETVKEEIKTYLRELQQISPAGAAPLATRDEADEIKKFPASQQVGVLISLVFEKGLSEAVSVAKELNNPAILDEFHDILADRYYKILLDKKIIKP